MAQCLLPLTFPARNAAHEVKGVVYTKSWVVDLLLDLAEYDPGKNLVDALAIEPATGAGAFLTRMAQRLVQCCRRQRRNLADCRGSIIAYEINDASSEKARDAVVRALMEVEVPRDSAVDLAASWIRTGDYLFEAFSLPPADYVIGNPPYVRLEDIPPEVASVYRDAYSTMQGRADLYIAFFEAALRQLRQNGVCAYICADRWMLNQYGAELRRFVTAGFAVETIVEMHNANAFDVDVTAYPAITAIRRAKQRTTVVASASAGAETANGSIAAALLRARTGEVEHSLSGARILVVDKWFAGANPWPCSSPERLKLLRQLEEHFEPLESRTTGTKVGIGVATGCDRAFITTDKDLVERSRLLPLAMAADTQTGRLVWSGNYLVDPWKSEGLVSLAEFPKLRAHLEGRRDDLCRRHTAQKNANAWYRTIDRVHHSLTARPKLYIPDIKDRFNPVLDHGTTYPHHNLYFIVSESWDLEVLGGLLLSAVGRLFIECYGVRMRGGYLRFQAQYLRRIRVPDPNSITKRQAARLIEAFRSRDRDLASATAADVYGVRLHDLEATFGY